MGVSPHQYSEKGHFYDWGLDDADSHAAGGRWTMRRLKSITRDLKHEGVSEGRGGDMRYLRQYRVNEGGEGGRYEGAET